MNDEITEALESAAPASGGGFLRTPMANKEDVREYARTVMRFLDELDADLTVGEIRSVLEDY